MLSRKRKMSPKKAVYVSQFGSQLSQRDDEPQTDRAEASSQCRGDKRKSKRGNDTEKKRVLLKVKLPKPPKRTLSRKEETKGDETPRGRILETENKTKPAVSPGGGKQRAGTQSDSAGDVFFFSEGPSYSAVNDKERAKLTVLRTISKMLEENQLIRQRLATLSQTNRDCTD